MVKILEFQLDCNKKYRVKNINKDFSGGPVVKNPPANVRDMGSIPGPGRCHMPQGN